MAKLLCKCCYCGEQFDRNSVENYATIPTGKRNRYAHFDCYAKEQEKQVLSENIKIYVKSILKGSYKASKVSSQIEKFCKEGMNPNDILNSLKYFYEVKNGNPEEACGGIGIVPYIIDESIEYYRKKEKKEKDIADSLDGIEIIGETKTVTISLTPIRKPKKCNLFDIH